MTQTYLIHPQNWGHLECSAEALCRQFERYLDRNAYYLSPVLFAEYSCLTQLVEEEIDLVVSNQARAGQARLSFDEFIAFWRWEGKLAEKVFNLSGGWRKLLAISLFLNRRCDHLLIVDLASHLSDATMRRVLDQIRLLQISSVGFAEYDPLILQKVLQGPRHLVQVGDRLQEST